MHRLNSTDVTLKWRWRPPQTQSSNSTATLCKVIPATGLRAAARRSELTFSWLHILPAENWQSLPNCNSFTFVIGPSMKGPFKWSIQIDCVFCCSTSFAGCNLVIKHVVIHVFLNWLDETNISTRFSARSQPYCIWIELNKSASQTVRSVLQHHFSLCNEKNRHWHKLCFSCL